MTFDLKTEKSRKYYWKGSNAKTFNDAHKVQNHHQLSRRPFIFSTDMPNFNAYTRFKSRFNVPVS